MQQSKPKNMAFKERDIMGNILSVQNATKKIGKKVIIEDISVSVNEGDILGFLGPNGAGKTTLIKMMTGLYSITGGEISVMGCDMVNDKVAALSNIGAVIENPEMYGYLSGLDNLKLWARMHKGVNKKRIAEVVRLVKLENRIKDKVSRYSLGMKQRLGIAQALLHRPKLLILDEPTNGLDPMGIKELRDMLCTLAKEEQIGVFVSSHILGEMEAMCNKFCIIDNGKTVLVCNKDELEPGELEEKFLKITSGSKDQIR